MMPRIEAINRQNCIANNWDCTDFHIMPFSPASWMAKCRRYSLSLLQFYRTTNNFNNHTKYHWIKYASYLLSPSVINRWKSFLFHHPPSSTKKKQPTINFPFYCEPQEENLSMDSHVVNVHTTFSAPNISILMLSQWENVFLLFHPATIGLAINFPFWYHAAEIPQILRHDSSLIFFFDFNGKVKKKMNIFTWKFTINRWSQLIRDFHWFKLRL